ncbi:MAG: DUF3416 domain-containing protein [Ornithinimicrobium sp.]|uniref:maltotransferase domain-containing protein n=1 Tax=Ornithinimicrobium sp. TaxID=1977084 RepID=UPI0026DFEB7C|nr:maltotransferase domain-containing protein [Ornithinimicrobium sp.]MDO5740241.1 DUF3416 domain-containing protein [Ornithinimicrobium sp.]
MTVFGQQPIGRIPVLDVQPIVDAGARPTRAVVNELFNVSATVFREGHDAVNATVVLVDPDDAEHQVAMRQDNPGLGHWTTTVFADREGMWSFRVEGWSDPYGTWRHDGTVKIEAGVDVELMLEEGARVLERAIDEVDRPPRHVAILTDAITRLRASAHPAWERLAAGISDEVQEVLAAAPLREYVSASPSYPLWIERQRALTGAWYEIFPRSEGAIFNWETGLWQTGTFASAAERLPAIAGMGFDIVYLTPVHPIGSTNRKGRNNTLNAGDHDPGSPYAIGSADGGHDALHPQLGGWDDFDTFVARAQAQGLEVALDLALQASPDHPWVTEHPEFFTTRADGSIAYAENPPKKYQDIYPVNFDNTPAAIYAKVREVVQVWIDHGVKIFRVDNPHTKPVEFWQWLIADVAVDHPEVIWLAEAFTKPMMMRALAKVGFQQSYTYYAWRNTAAELREYVEELSTQTAHYMRPNFWPTTHDILTPYMQTGGTAAHLIRSALAATLVPSYGIYTGYEHVEWRNRPGAEEHLDNEKYEFKDRRWGQHVPGREDLSGWLTMLNRARRDHPSLQWLRNITFHEAENDNFLVFSKHGGGAHDGSDRDTVLVVANLDPHHVRGTRLHLHLPALGLGLDWDHRFRARDLVTGNSWVWDRAPYVRLGPGYGQEPVHIIHVTRD